MNEKEGKTEIKATSSSPRIYPESEDIYIGGHMFTDVSRRTTCLRKGNATPVLFITAENEIFRNPLVSFVLDDDDSGSNSSSDNNSSNTNNSSGT
ncbi:hypothetical protein V1477_005917 [Vespula maculifrons]|uniref:Uncharacterized protein n=1 Tax=Vespula maculifrons TaxID=7453 RepID=A0ABD2CMG2_VESMC